MAFQTYDWPSVGQMLYASNVSLRDDYNDGCPGFDIVAKSR
jgi:galactokinase